MARLDWPGQSPLGQCLMLDDRNGPCTLVVGVAADSHRMQIVEGPGSQIFVPISQAPRASPAVIIVRTRPGSDVAVTRAATDILRARVPTMTSVRARTFASVFDRELRPWRLGATLFTALGILALAVSSVGIYSVVGFGVSQRVHEMGIRMAVGARAQDIVDLVVGDGLRVLGIGIAIGIVVALASGRLVESLLFGVRSNDVSILIGTTAVLCAVSAIACLVPALRAARIDPVAALRSD
jgi:ABC-type antimicrobial peptide transport system permease subunit